MRFKRLSLEDLKALENQFIQFLAAQGIAGMDWEQMKDSNPDKVDELIDLFSDMVYSSSLETIKYLIKIEHNFVFLIDTSLSNWQNLIFRLNDSALDDDVDMLIAKKAISYISTAVKASTNDSLKEKFELIESGFKICTPQIFDKLKQLEVIG